jgi:cytochrome d ubiquinol oxidase subunit II
MTLVAFWFVVIAVLWTGFFVLEGFDFGVGMLHGVVGQDEESRRTAVGTIGPLWDGNEVWLIVAGAAIFAAFPGWYATMFSGFYLALLLLLVALILRGVSLEYRAKSDSPRWRQTWGHVTTVSSLLAPLLIGVALADLLHGLPIDANQEYTGNFWDLLSPYSVFSGLTFVVVCALHGATFLALKTSGELRTRALRAGRLLAPAAVPVVIAFALWTRAESDRGAIPNLAEVTAILAVVAAAWLVYEDREGWAFAATAVTIACCVLSIFADLYPNVMVSSTDAAYNLTAQNSASGSYALKVMTVVVALFLPFVLAYQTWTYYVFRRRVGGAGNADPVPADPVPTQPTTPTPAGRA